MAFKVLCVDHVGVAVNDLALIKKQMKDLLNLEPSLPDETVEEQHVTTSFFKPSAQSEACELELSKRLLHFRKMQSLTSIGELVLAAATSHLCTRKLPAFCWN